jgi:hypothetical protein
MKVSFVTNRMSERLFAHNVTDVSVSTMHTAGGLLNPPMCDKVANRKWPNEPDNLRTLYILISLNNKQEMWEYLWSDLITI